jgi:ATP-dependent Zn proteases
MTETGTETAWLRSLRPLALLATGRTGADIERLVREVRRRASRAGRPMAWHDLEEALRDRAAEVSDDLRWRMAVHEAGHTVAYILLDVGEVETVMIGTPQGGKVLARVNQEVLQMEKGLMRLMACILAGRAAETILFDTVLVGSGGNPESDLARATALAVEAETSLGLSPTRPLLYRPPGGSDALLYNPQLVERVNARLEAAMEAALTLLRTNEGALLSVARELNEHRVLDGEQVRALVTEGSR